MAPPGMYALVEMGVGLSPSSSILIEWFEMEAQDLIARHRDRDDDAAMKLYFAEMAEDD